MSSQDPIHGPSGLRWSPACYRLALTALVITSQLFFWVDRRADPPLGWGTDGRVLAEGLAALDAARAAVGEVGAPETGSGPVLVTIPATLIFRFVGVGIASSRALSIFGTVGLALWVAWTLRRRFGDAPALIGAALVLFHGASFALARSPSALPWLTLGTVALIGLGSRRGKVAPCCALGMAMFFAVLGSPMIGAAILPLLFESLLRSTSVRRFLGAMPFPAAALGAGVAAIAWATLPIGVRQEAVRILLGSGGDPSSPPILAVAPALFPLAWCGWLLFVTHVDGERGPGRSLERLLHGAVWVTLALRASSGGVDASDLAGVIPLLAWLAVAATQRAGERPRLRALPLHGARGALFCVFGALGTLMLAHEARIVLTPDGGAVRGLPVPWVGLILVLGFGLPRGRRGRGPVVALVIGTILLGSGLWQSASCLGHPGRSLERSADQLEREVLPTATLSGPWARAVTLENDLAWGIDGESTHATHRLHVGAKNAETLSLDTHQVMGRAVTIARVPDRIAAWSAFELGRQDEEEGRASEARARYFLVLHGEPRHSPSWQRIAATLITEGSPRDAYRCLLNALTGNPDAPEIHVGLAAVYLDHGRPDDATHHLRRAEETGAPAPVLAPLYERLEELRSR